MDIINDSVTICLPNPVANDSDYKAWEFGEFTVTIEKLDGEWIPAIFMDSRDYQDPNAVPYDVTDFAIRKAQEANHG